MKQENDILELYSAFEREKTNSKEYDKLLKKLNQLRETFGNTLNEQQKNELETLFQIYKEMGIIENKEYYEEGFCKAAKIMTEVFYKEDTN